MSLVWEEPPLPVIREHWAEVAEALRARPGEWAVVGDDLPGGYSTRIKNGTLAAFRPAGSFETRGAPNAARAGRFKVWARYIGQEQDQ